MKALRERAGLTQQQLATQLGISLSAVQKWDRGQSFPKMYPIEIKGLAQALGCSFADLEEAQRNWQSKQED